MKSKLFTITLVMLLMNTVFGANLTSGHADLGLGEGTELELHLHYHEGAVIDGVTGVEGELEPGDVTIVVPNSTLFSRPAGAAWDLIGNSAGDDTWLLPESETDADTLGSPFLGIGAEEVTLGTWVGNELTLTLINVSGPGHFSLYNVTLGTPTFEMSSFDGYGDSIVMDLDVHDHEHFNYGFSAAGVYDVTFEVSATNATSGLLETATDTFTFNVIPEPATLSLLALGGVALLRKRKK